MAEMTKADWKSVARTFDQTLTQIRGEATEALSLLNGMTTDQFGQGGDKRVRDALARILRLIGDQSDA